MKSHKLGIIELLSVFENNKSVYKMSRDSRLYYSTCATHIKNLEKMNIISKAKKGYVIKKEFADLPEAAKRLCEVL